jgi:hypothetical protein
MIDHCCINDTIKKTIVHYLKELRMPWADSFLGVKQWYLHMLVKITAHHQTCTFETARTLMSETYVTSPSKI